MSRGTYGMSQQKSTLSEYLSEELRKRNWSGRQLATEAGISQSSVARVLRGDNVPKSQILRKMAKALEISETHLLHLAGHVEATPVLELDPKAAYIAERLSSLPPKTRQRAVNAIGSVVEAFWEMVEEQATTTTSK